MSSLNGLSSGLINFDTVGRGLAASTGFTEELLGDIEHLQFIQPGVGTIVSCDATLAESHQYDNSPTQYPVEDGSSISDHIIVNPLTVTVTGVVSDTPVGTKDQLKQSVQGIVQNAFLPPLGVGVLATAYALYNTTLQDPTPSQTAFNALVRLRSGDPAATPPSVPQPFTIITKFQRYESMVMTSLQFPVDASTDGQLVFTATCTKLILVAPQFISLSKLDNKALAAAERKVGQKQGKQRVGFDDGLADEQATVHVQEQKLANGMRAYSRGL